DLEGRLWRIPAEKMKGRQEHLIPLSRQAMTIIISLRPLTGHRRYLFPANRAEKSLSGGTVRGVLKRAGYGPGIMTAHGFRHMASTRLHDAGVPSYLVERQLAHKDSNVIRDSYNAAEYIDDRTTMMQYWSDCIDAYKTGSTPLKWKEYLDDLKADGNVVPLRRVI
ncbi:MAG: site-specific integrase, partial [Proteobacteria bacterium]|nr:site-specific integrase [Pseudomonadota bacterium]